MKINGVDARLMGVMMGDGFLDALDLPAPLKDYVTNNSAVQHGTQILPVVPKLAERDVTLTFNIEGSSEAEFDTRKANFIALLYKGWMQIEVLGVKYNLVYKRAQTFSYNRQRTFCSIAVRFIEPDPNNRV